MNMNTDITTLRKYSSFVSKIDDTTNRRAKLEWSNTWIDEANSEGGG